MKFFVPALLLVLTGCGIDSTAKSNDNTANQNSSPTFVQIERPEPSPTVSRPENKTNTLSDECADYEPIEIPPTESKVGRIDFFNLAYPRIYEKGRFKLKNGCLYKETTYPGLSVEIWTLESIDFVDFDGDGIDEALVGIHEWSGSGSSGTNELFFIFRGDRKNPQMIFKMTTGSRAFCGLKEYELKDKRIYLELFGKCSLKPNGDFDDTGIHKYDYAAEDYTKLVFGWNGRRFGVIDREVLPFPEGDIKDYGLKHPPKK